MIVYRVAGVALVLLGTVPHLEEVGVVLKPYFT